MLLYIYSPHLDFATKVTVLNDSNSTLMEFQRVAFSRNPSNSVTDKCYEDGECRQPITLVHKLGNPQLRTLFKEMIDFLENFEMSSTDLNQIIAEQIEIEQIAQTLSNAQYIQTWYV